MNVQYAIQRDTVYVLEVNPRASRTVPYVSKATGVPLAKVAARLMAGRKLRDMNLPLRQTQRRRGNRRPRFLRREVAGVPVQQIPRRRYDSRPGDALHRRSDGRLHILRPGVRQGATRRRPATAAQGHSLHQRQRSRQAPHRPLSARNCSQLGFRLLATRGTAAALEAAGIEAESVFKVNEGRPNIVDLVKTAQDRSGHQHAARPRIVLRRKIHPPRRNPLQHSLHHHAFRRHRRRKRNPSDGRPRR